MGDTEEKSKGRGRPTNLERLSRSSSIGSVGDIGDLWKRKRENENKDGQENEDGTEIFQQSKKMQRTPQKNEETESKIERMLKEMRYEFKQEMQKVKQEVREMRVEMKEEMGKMREEIRRGEKEREELKVEIREIEKRVEALENKENSVWEIEEKIKKYRAEIQERTSPISNGEGKENLEERVKEMEAKVERQEKEKRRRNIIIKNVQIQGTIKETVNRIFEWIGAQARIEEAREVGRRGSGRKEGMIEVKMETIEGKYEVMRKKVNLRGRKERIEEDLTWKERRMQWLIRERAEEEKRKGKRVIIRYGKLIVNGETWVWDEEREVIKNRMTREGEQEMKLHEESRNVEGQKGEEKVLEGEEEIVEPTEPKNV